MPAEDELSGLRDIFIPDDMTVSVFPPAIGWWGLLIIAVVAFAAYKIIVRYRLNSVRGYCLRQMLYLENDFNADHNLKAYAEGVSVLLKRYAILKYGHESVANLYGKQWKKFLKEHSEGIPDDRVLDIIVNSPYYPDIYDKVDTKAFNDFVKGFVRR